MSDPKYLLHHVIGRGFVDAELARLAPHEIDVSLVELCERSERDGCRSLREGAFALLAHVDFRHPPLESVDARNRLAPDRCIRLLAYPAERVEVYGHSPSWSSGRRLS